MTQLHSTWITPVAKAGLISKGFVYFIIGLLAFMAAFHIGGHSSSEAGKKGVLDFLEDLPAGKWLLLAIAMGLVCYTIWRFVEAFNYKSKSDGGDTKKWGTVLRYLLSGLIYFSLAVAAFRMVLNQKENSGNNNFQQIAAGLLNKPFGQWLLGLLALLIAGIGIYQFYYGLSEKYKKHITELNLQSGASSLLHRSGKVGYIARGIVWLIIAWLLANAALHANAAEAGDTTDAFQFLQQGTYGPYLLGALGAGFVCYGIFNFIRSRYDSFE